MQSSTRDRDGVRVAGPWQSRAAGYVLALVITAVAVATRWLLDPLLGDHLELVTLFGAVAAVAWFGGYRPAVLAAIAGYVGTDYLIIELPGTAVLARAVVLAAYVLSCGLLILFAEVARRARLEAMRQRDRMRTTFASVGDAVITTDVGGLVTSMNPVAESLTGWVESDAVGRPLDDVFRIINEETRRPVESPAVRAIRDGVIVGLANHTLLIARDGAERPIDDSAAPISNPSSGIVGCVLVFRDVTERRRADRAIRRSERELTDLFDNASIGIHWVGPDGTILRANQAELDLMGYTHDEYVGRHIAEFHVDRSVIDGILVRIKKGETLTEHPARLRRKDGSIVHVLINTNGSFESGEFMHSRCFTLDVTDRRRAEEAHTLLAAIVSASDDAIISKTLDGVILSWNAGAERLFGYTSSEAVGQSIDLIIPPELRDEELQILEQLRRGERIDHFETVRVAKDGRRIHISLSISPLRDEAGRLVGASKVARDITHRMQAEEALRRGEERFRELANNIDQFAWTCDELGIATWYNKRWYEYTGTTFADMQGDGWKKVHHPEHIQRVAAGLAAAVASGQPWEDTFPLRGKNGAYRWFLSRAVPIHDPSGVVIRWFGTNTDVTEQVELEKALKRADRRKDEFLATLSHELRNPLGPISNALELLKISDGDEGTLRKSQATIDRQLTHLVRLVDDLLDVSRITRDRVELRRARVELASVIHQAVETVSPLTGSADQVVDVDLPQQPIYLDADPIRLAQVFGNLLNNAAKYTSPGGRIRLSAERTGMQVEVTVEDEGIGIPPEQLESIFEMFAQVDSSLERSWGGLGIGLTLVRRLAEMHGGTVEAYSEGLGHGSRFVVTLPITDALPRSQPQVPVMSQTQGSRPCRVLVVDDNRDSVDSLAILLDVHGHETRVAYDGPEALAVGEQFRPEVVLLDIGLPTLNGFEVCRKMRDSPWGKDITIIALTGWGQDQYQQQSNDAGFDQHMVKPPDIARLTAILASLPAPSE